MARFKVGDMVKIREGLKGDNTYGYLYFHPDMEQFCGKVGRITGIYNDHYIIDGCDDWTFSDDMVTEVFEIEVALPETLMKKDQPYTLSESEAEYLTAKGEELLQNYGYDTDNIGAVYDEWARNKGWLINLFKRSEEYVDGKFYIYKKAQPLLRPVDKNAVNEFVLWAKNTIRDIAKQREIKFGFFTYAEMERMADAYYNLSDKIPYGAVYNGMTRDMYHGEYRRVTAKLSSVKGEHFRGAFVSADDYKSFTSAYKVFCALEEIVGRVPDPSKLDNDFVTAVLQYNDYTLKAKPSVGMSTTKFVGKVMRELGMDKIVDLQKTTWVDENTGEVHERVRDMGYNKYRAMLGDAINPYTYDRDIVISVNPIDYWAMSFGTDWASCHTIDKRNDRNMSNTYNGMHSSGTESYMLDSSTFVVYVVPDGEWLERNGEENMDVELRSKFKRVMFSMGEDKLLEMRVYPDGRDGGDSGLATQLRNIVQKEIANLYNTDNMWTLKKGADECRSVTTTYGTHYADYNCCNDCNVSYLRRVDGLLNTKRIVIGHNPICPGCGNEHTEQENIMCNECNGNSRKCPHCGEYFSEDGYTMPDGTEYCSYECAENDGWVWCDNINEYANEDDSDVHYCEQCDTWFYNRGDAVYVDGNWYCDDDCASRAGYVWCEYDNEYAHEDDVIFIEECGEYFVNEESAREAGYVYDEDASEWIAA